MKEVCAVTGASGYVGSRLVKALAAEYVIVPLSRQAGESVIPYDMAAPKDVADDLRARNVKVLVHAAWMMNATNRADYWRVNVEGSKQIIESALAAGVERIIFISTISSFEGARSLYGRAKFAVESMVTTYGGISLRSGLVWGDRAGGMFGSLHKQIGNGGTVPLIGDGRYPQFLVHEDDLADVVLTASGVGFQGPVHTIAHPTPWLLRDLILHIAADEGKSIKLVGIPWRLIYSGLRIVEVFHLKLRFRSDSVISLVYQNLTPQFSAEIMVRAFH